MLSLKFRAAIFWMNLVYPTAIQWMGYTKLHQWARKKLRESTRTLIPLALKSYQESYPKIVADPNVRYTFYPAVNKQGLVEIMCFGETGLSLQGAFAHIEVGPGLSSCVFHANADGQIDE